jgi:endonuclease YncB( thermonuclease family)
VAARSAGREWPGRARRPGVKGECRRSDWRQRRKLHALRPDEPPNCVIDGDTIRLGGVKIRLEDIDAPEVFSPKCASELARGNRATERLLALLNQGPFELVRTGRRDRDRYGRKLRTLERSGRSLGAVLVAEGLARPWDGARHPWCG